MYTKEGDIQLKAKILYKMRANNKLNLQRYKTISSNKKMKTKLHFKVHQLNITNKILMKNQNFNNRI